MPINDVLTFLPGFAARAVSFQRTADALREAGFRFSNSAFRAAYRDARHAVDVRPLLVRYPSNRVIPESLITPAKNVYLGAFRYTFQMTGVDSRTNTPQLRYVSLVSGNRLTRGGAISSMDDALRRRPGDSAQDFRITGIELEAVYRRDEDLIYGDEDDDTEA